MSRVVRKPAFCIWKTKTQISLVITAKLISAFVFATQIVQSLYFLNLKFQASNHLLWLCSLVCVGPGRKPRRPVFSQRGSYRCRSLCRRQVSFTCKHFRQHQYCLYIQVSTSDAKSVTVCKAMPSMPSSPVRQVNFFGQIYYPPYHFPCRFSHFCRAYL